MMKLKVYGGTPNGENRCEKCQNRRVIKGIKDSDEIRLCDAIKGRVSFDVAECSFYKEKVDLSKYKDCLILKFDRQTQQLLVNPTMFSRGQTIDEYRGVQPENLSASAKSLVQ